MIQRLTIQNYAIINHLEIDFSPGLTIITGETGAGKSILLGALGLIMGKRADTKALYSPETKCIIEAFFDISQYRLEPFLDENDIDYDGPEVVIRREILPSGKSRAFVNDSPANLQLLQDLADKLLDLHQQFDTLDLHKNAFQLQMIDALAGNHTLLVEYAEEFRQLQTLRKEHASLIQQRDQTAREEEFLRFQFEELSAANLKPGEGAGLEEELDRLTNAEEIKRTAGNVAQALNETDPSAIDQLNDMAVSLANLTKFHSGLNTAHQRFRELIIELADLSQDLQSIAEETEHDEERLLVVEQRLDMLYRLQAKHQVGSVEELISITSSFASRLESISDSSAKISSLETLIKQQEETLVRKAETLRAQRQKVIPAFETTVSERLHGLNMPHARLNARLEPLEQLNETGLDHMEILFSANKGTMLNPIRDVASGGEMARLTLVIKSLVAGAIPLPTIIFDEIDTGVSGDVALRMGQILRSLSDSHQVVSITHSPQIASKADDHYFVYKEVQDERTVTKVRKLDDEGRIRAIAVMLSSNPPSESALENARELISGH